MSLDSRLQLRLDVEDLYADYVDSLDNDELERWPDFFTDGALYKVIARENFDHDLPLATMLCEGRGMLQDRVQAIRDTSTFAPRYLRHLISSIRVREEDGVLHGSASYIVMETLVDEETRVFNAGRYLDRLVRQNGVLRFEERLCIYDSLIIPNSLIYPI